MSIKKITGNGSEFIEVLPDFVDVWPSMNNRFMHRLRGELQGSHLCNREQMLQCAERIRNAYAENLVASDTCESTITETGFTLRVYEQGLPNRDIGGGGKGALSIEVADPTITIEITAYNGRSIKMIIDPFTEQVPGRLAPHEVDRGMASLAYVGNVGWEINFGGGSIDAANLVKEILGGTSISFEEA